MIIRSGSTQYGSIGNIASVSGGKRMAFTMLKSLITTDEKAPRTLAPLHPGEVLREEYMDPLGLSAGKIAKAANVPRTRIERIVREEIGITADTAVRLGKIFATSPEFWMNLQARHDLLVATAALEGEMEGIRVLGLIEIPSP
jgi:addiction module HigA family antidote